MSEERESYDTSYENSSENEKADINQQYKSFQNFSLAEKVPQRKRSGSLAFILKVCLIGIVLAFAMHILGSHIENTAPPSQKELEKLEQLRNGGGN